MDGSQDWCAKHHCATADCDERSHNFTVRLSGTLRRAAQARARREGTDLSEILRRMVEDWAGEAEPGARFDHRRLEAAQAELGRVTAELAALKADVSPDADSTEGGDRFIEALKGATPDRPVATERLIAVSDLARYTVRRVLTILVREGYVFRTARGWYAYVPGTDLREGMRIARKEVQHGAARIAPSKRDAPDDSAPVPEAHSAARKKNGRIARVAERAGAAGAPLVAAKDVPRPAVSAATAVFQEPGSELVVTAEVPEAADHSAAPGKPRGSSRKRCEHRLPAGAWCKTCQQPK